MAERAPGDPPRVLLLAGDRRSDAGDVLVEAGRPRAVADIEVQSAMRRHERPLVRDDDVADGDGSHAEDEPGDEECRGAYAARDDDHHERDAERREQHVGPVECLNAPDEAGEKEKIGTAIDRPRVSA